MTDPAIPRKDRQQADGDVDKACQIGAAAGDLFVAAGEGALHQILPGEVAKADHQPIAGIGEPARNAGITRVQVKPLFGDARLRRPTSLPCPPAASA